jgi:four helix bundle protein
MDLAEAVYSAATQFPRQEEYRLTSQLLRAVVSIPANIAEGNARATRKEYARFIAKGSAAEVETLLLLAVRTNLIPPSTSQPLLKCADEIARMLNSLHTRLTS